MATMSTRLRTHTERQTRSGLGWEEPACPLCESNNRTTILEAQDPQAKDQGLWFPLVECHDCGLTFNSPRPDEATIGDFYPIEYTPHRYKEVRNSHKSPFTSFRRRPCVERRVLPPHGQCRLLDFGCGAGLFLEHMHRHKWQ